VRFAAAAIEIDIVPCCNGITAGAFGRDRELKGSIVKLLFPIAAALAVAVTATAAPAFDRVVHTTVVKTVHHPVKRWRNKRVCNTVFVRHRKVTNCKTVRVPY
jgi:hypothetical protein